MQQKLFPTPSIERKYRSGLLGVHYDCFVEWQEKRGYSPESIRYNIQRVAHFSKYLEKLGILSVDQLAGESGQKLLASYKLFWEKRGHWNRNWGLKLYIKALEDNDIIVKHSIMVNFLAPEIKEYINFLKSQKGDSASTVNYQRYWTEKFLKFLGYRNYGSKLPDFTIKEIDNFIESEGVHYKRTTMQLMAGVLRGFIRFLYQSGKIKKDLSYLIKSPNSYQFESLPEVLDFDELKTILQNIHPSSKTPHRDYAVLNLLFIYGLRSGEVASLKLKDINWRDDIIHITQKKTRRELCLPLMPQVGKAIIKYLKHERPPSTHEELFLLSCAPRTSLKSGSIGYMVRRQIKFAGLNSSTKGPHLIRHSFATYLLRKNVSLKEIGDILGHQSIDSTHIYTKTATEKLREVALPIPEVE